MHTVDNHILLTEGFVQINSKKFAIKDYADNWSSVMIEFAETTGISLDVHYREFDTVYGSHLDPKGVLNRLILLCADVLRKGLATVEFDERTYERMMSLSKFVNHPDVFLNIYARDSRGYGNTRMLVLGYRGKGVLPDISVRRPGKVKISFD